MTTPITDTRADGRDLRASIPAWQSPDADSPCGEIIPPAPDSGGEGTSPTAQENPIATPQPDKDTPDGVSALLQAIGEIGRLHMAGYRLWQGAMVRVDVPVKRGGLWFCEVWYWNYYPAELRHTYGYGFEREMAVYRGLRSWRTRKPVSRFVQVVEPAETDECPYFDADPRATGWYRNRRSTTRYSLNVMAWG